MAPLLVGVIGVALTAWFNAQQNERQNALEDRRAEEARYIEEQRAQDEALQAYLAAVGSLILNDDNQELARGETAHTLVQARTSTVIPRLDAKRNRSVIRFLSAAGLTGEGESIQALGQPTNSVLLSIDLPGADLAGVDLSGADIRGANLNGANLSSASLGHANLSGTQLHNANLSGAFLEFASVGPTTDLSDANLRGAYLEGADFTSSSLANADLSNANLVSTRLVSTNLRNANLSGADLSSSPAINVDRTDLSGADLSGANLSGANLSDADLSDADLSGTDLSGADLRGASGVTKESLEQQAETLRGATMPDGSKSTMDNSKHAEEVPDGSKGIMSNVKNSEGSERIGSLGALAIFGAIVLLLLLLLGYFLEYRP